LIINAIRINNHLNEDHEHKLIKILIKKCYRYDYGKAYMGISKTYPSLVKADRWFIRSE